MRSRAVACRRCASRWVRAPRPRTPSRRLGAAVSAGAVGEQGRAAPAGLRPQAPRAAAAPEARRAERADHPARRRRLRPGVDVRRRDQHADAVAASRDQGIRYNTFHTTAICSPTRAALLTGRNHQRVGNGTIAERAVDWDGYTGVIPKTSATMAEVLRALRLQDRRLRQVAQHAGRPDHGDGPVRPLADRARLRLLLRLPRRRDVAVGAAAGREHRRRSSRRTTRSTT